MIPLGDRLFDLIIQVFIACWAIGWIVLLVVMALQYMFPKRASAFERALQSMGKVLSPVLYYTGIAALVLVALRLVASWLGWAPPIPSGDPGDYDPRG
jgi:cytochrome b561